MEKNLHIICLDIPFPVDHGGLYDLFYKLPSLQASGVKILMHCFYRNKKPQPELNKYCEQVFYYNRITGAKGLSPKIPYIVASRKNEILLNRLLQDDYPILMEGIHCTYPALDDRFNLRQKFVRLHNVEHLYYESLSACSKNFFKKIYYRNESKLLARYESQLVKKVTSFWAVANNDAEYYRKKFLCENIHLLPLFWPQCEVESKEGIGTYCLYHGNLSVDENEFAAGWLIKNIFSEFEIPFIIAGKNPSKKLIQRGKKYAHVSVIENPSEKEMSDIIKKAQLHILPSYNNTGIKLKLLNALYNGRHCITNSATADGTGLQELCHITTTKQDMKEKIKLLFSEPFTISEIDKRKKVLTALFNNKHNTTKMIQWIWGE